MCRSIVAVAGIAAIVQLLCAAGPACAVVIATDDFQSYALGDVLGQGAVGSGWESAYTGLATEKTGSTPLRDVSSGVMAGFGQSLELGHTVIGERPSNNNIVQRLFTPQTDTIYVGFAFKTTGFDLEGTGYFAGDFFQVYVNNTSNESGTAGSQGDSLSCGVDINPAPDEGEPSGVFAGKGGKKTGPSPWIEPANNVVHRMVMKLSKSGTGFPTPVYDQVAVWVDRETELATPDAARGAGEATDPTFDTISVLHLRIWGMELDDRVYIDSLSIATTYAEALPTLPPVPTIPGDTDGNQIVNEADAAVLAGNWGQNVGAGGFGSGDFNDDEVVNAADASILAANWGDHRGEGAASVPEPGMIGLAVSLALAALARRSRAGRGA